MLSSELDEIRRQIRRQGIAAGHRWERSALRALAQMRHPSSLRDQRAFVRRHATLDGLPLTPVERERLDTVTGVAMLAFFRGRWGGAPTQLTPRILRLLRQAKACLRRDCWDDARRLWREAEGYDQLERDHQQEREMVRLRPLAAQAAKSRRALRAATEPRQGQAAERRAKILAEAQAVARDWRRRLSTPEATQPSKAAVARAVFGRWPKDDDNRPSVRTIRRVLPARLTDLL